MNKPFEAEIEWEAVSGSRGRENRATWGRLKLLADGQPITRVLDHRAKSYRDHILVPLYPVTEWIVTHWWSLFYEPESPGRKGYGKRHNLRFGREGYAFPELYFRPVGDFVLLDWSPLEIDGGISFSSMGAARIEREQLQESLSDWVELVIARLEQQEINNSVLQEEWAAIQATTEEERAFCITAAQLGRDPYSLSKRLEEQMIQAEQALPATWHEDFFSAVDVEQLEVQANYALLSRDVIRQHRSDLGNMITLRNRAAKLDQQRTPWQQGYDVARWLRHETNTGVQPLATDEALSQILGVPSLPVQSPRVSQHDRWLDAIVDMNENGTGGFIATSQRPENRRFAFCRALFEYLTDIDAPSALITVARTERQKRNRAFAAELLAPSEWLRHEYSDELLGPEDIEDAADTLGVSSEVIYRQLKNHKIAGVVD